MKQGKYGLALHTTTTELGLALIDVTETLVKTEVKDLEGGLMNHLHPCLKEFLQGYTWQDLAFIAVAKGPGSFTSTRVGMVTARTLAQQLDIPLLAISTLAARAQEEAKNFSTEMLIATQLSAGGQKYYVAIYEKLQGQEMVSSVLLDTTRDIQEWQEQLTQLERPYILVEGDQKLGYTVSSLLKLAYALWLSGVTPSWSQGLPFYDQNSLVVDVTAI